MPKRIIALGVVAVVLLGLAVWFFSYALSAVIYNQTVAAANSPLPASFHPPPTEAAEDDELPGQNQPVMAVASSSPGTIVTPIVVAATPVLSNTSLVVGKPSPTSMPSNTPTRTPTATRTSVPVLSKVVRLAIPLASPRIGVDSAVEPVGLVKNPECVKTNGEVNCLPYFGTPEKAIGWHNLSGLPGQNRTIEFNGHIQWNKKEGVFRWLGNVSIDDEVILTTADSIIHKYVVRQILYFPWGTNEGSNYLRELEKRGEEIVVMITCATWSPEKQIYVNRLYIVAVAK